MTEVYKDLPGWEGIYKVSDHGNVKSLDRNNSIGRRIKGRTMKVGNAKESTKVNLCSGLRSISETYTVGHLVLTTFIGEKPDGSRARHRDGNFMNNNLENLYWGPHAPNKKKAIHE